MDGKKDKHASDPHEESDDPDEKKKKVRAKMDRLCACDRLISESEILSFGDISKFVNKEGEALLMNGDECTEDLEYEYLKISHMLDLPEESYSLTKIETNLPRCLKYGFRSGRAHIFQKYSPLTRTYRAQAAAVTALATTFLIKPQCWNEPVIDQVIEDSHVYYATSYEKIAIHDRRVLTVQDLKSHIYLRGTHRLTLKIHDPTYAGTFRSDNPKEFHIGKALESFFKKFEGCILSSPVLNIAIWKNGKHFNIFDGQPRLETCDIANEETEEAATCKLIVVQNLTGVLFIILEKSNVENEPFVLYRVTIENAEKINELVKKEDIDNLPKPKRRPSGYRIQEEFRAVIQGSFHLLHPILPEELQGTGDLVIGVAAIIYSKMVHSYKWTKVMVDLIINQANIFLADLVRVHGKKLDNSLRLTINDLFCDVVLGVYSAKIKIVENAVPGPGKKGKSEVVSSIREFFTSYDAGILELKNHFYGIWREKDKYYFLDPYGCDHEGFRVDPNDPEQAAKYQKAAACVTMNSSINQMVETIMENTESGEKEALQIHSISVLCIKTGTKKDGSDEKVIFREKKTNRRPPAPPVPESVVDECVPIVDPVPRPRWVKEGPVKERIQVPEYMYKIEDYIPTFDENAIELPPPKISKCNPPPYEPKFEIINHHRLMLQANKSALYKRFHPRCRGRQGLLLGISALAFSRVKEEPSWVGSDLDKIINDGTEAYERIVNWIHRGSPDDFEDTGTPQYIKEMEAQMEAVNKQMNTLSAKDEFKGLNHLILPMMPKVFRVGLNLVHMGSKMNCVVGKANPLVNLAEALEHYFDNFDDAIIENRKLMYAVWKREDKYYLFDPYGCGREGWRDNDGPASFLVVDSIGELVRVLYGTFEYNCSYFSVHYIQLAVQTPHEIINEEEAPVVQVPSIENFIRFKTAYLPVTEEQLRDLKTPPETFLKCEDFGIDETIGEKQMGEGEEEAIPATCSESWDLDEPLDDLFERIDEPFLCDPPPRLNLSLITGVIKIENEDEDEQYERDLDIFYEKLKYSHPPPFVLPPKKNLCDLLNIKLASKSVHSLLSRFSIDTKLSVKPEKPAQGEEIVSIKTTVDDKCEEAKLITLLPKKYFYTKSLPCGIIPMRAVDEAFIRDKIHEAEEEEACRRQKLLGEVELVPADRRGSSEMILPTIIPLGHCMVTPEPKFFLYECKKKKKKKCPLSKEDEEDAVLKKLVCSTEDLLFEMIFPNQDERCCEIRKCEECPPPPEPEIKPECPKEEKPPEPCGFRPTHFDNIGIIAANSNLTDRESIEECYYKTCYFAAMLCILAKINVDPQLFKGEYLDRFIATANKISEGAGKLRFKMVRWFKNLHIMDVKYHVILKQVQYADPSCYEPDELENVLKNFFKKHQTGIVAFSNVSYAFWKANDKYYLFDPYACDEDGSAAPQGNACLMQICNFECFVCRMSKNTGEAAEKPYRIYSVAIAHLEPKKKKKSKKCSPKACDLKEKEAQVCEESEDDTTESEDSLIELSRWVTGEDTKVPPIEPPYVGFMPIKGYNASAIEIEILENPITRPLMPPFKKSLDPSVQSMSSKISMKSSIKTPADLERIRVYDRAFFDNSVQAEPMSLCMMAWAQIYEPTVWSTRTYQSLFAASIEYVLDSQLAKEDSSVGEIVDGLLDQFNIANFNFRVAFAPLHSGTLYAMKGWNLAMSLEKIFDSPVYTGAFLVCGTKQIGVMKKQNRMYAWWFVKWSKKIRAIVSEDMEEYLKLIVKEIKEPTEVEYCMRIVTISYAKMFGPNCSDLEGLHESMMPTTALAEIHRKYFEDFNMEDVFRPTNKSNTPVFIHGTVSLKDRDEVVQPKLKRCYFASLFAVTLKRDIIQNPLPGMIDNILEMADITFKLFEDPKCHMEHIIRDVMIMDRRFEFRDCSSQVVSLLNEDRVITKNLSTALNKTLKQYFKKYSSGILQFTNCCFGFWYSDVTRCYYYLDPYMVNDDGIRVNARGNACLFIFGNLCDMTTRMCINQFKHTTGFFVHRIHVESVDSLNFGYFIEDPIWSYLDYHWSQRHLGKTKKERKRYHSDQVTEFKKPAWKNYLVEVPNMIYSVWGSISAFDPRFGSCGGKNSAAICIATFALRFLCHPAEWSAAVLDSAVIIGDSYFMDSLKNPATRCLNRYGLLECLKVAPYTWHLEFKKELCGILYGSPEQSNLAASMEDALTRSSNVLIMCKKKVVGVLQTSDSYYVVDCAWTGPPLFSRHHGAIYAVRCKNFNTTIYVVTKMMNTNQRLQFTVSPVVIAFKQEKCQSSDKTKVDPKQILNKPMYNSPGFVTDHPPLVTGSEAVSEEDSYLCYSRNLRLGVAHGKTFELSHKVVQGPHKKAGVCKIMKKKCGKKVDPVVAELQADLRYGESMPRIMTKKVSVPQLIDFYEGINHPFLGKKPDSPIPAELCRARADLEMREKEPKEPLDIRGNFVCDETRAAFELYNCEMAKIVYKNYEHSCKERRRTAQQPIVQDSAVRVESVPKSRSQKSQGSVKSHRSQRSHKSQKSEDCEI